MTDTLAIVQYHKQGMSVRAIQKMLGISSPSLVQWHITKYKSLMEKYVLPERLANNGKDLYMCLGWNAYREEMIKVIENDLRKESV